MSLPRDSKRFPGTQSDKYSYDRNDKPIAQPPCDRPDQHQFGSAIEGQYIDVTGDRWNNEIPQDWSNHNEATPGMGLFGSRQFSDFSRPTAIAVTEWKFPMIRLPLLIGQIPSMWT